MSFLPCFTRCLRSGRLQDLRTCVQKSPQPFDSISFNSTLVEYNISQVSVHHTRPKPVFVVVVPSVPQWDHRGYLNHFLRNPSSTNEVLDSGEKNLGGMKRTQSDLVKEFRPRGSSGEFSELRSKHRLCYVHEALHTNHDNIYVD